MATIMPRPDTNTEYDLHQYTSQEWILTLLGSQQIAPTLRQEAIYRKLFKGTKRYLLIALKQQIK